MSEQNSDHPNDTQTMIDKLYERGIIESTHLDELSDDELVLLGREMLARKPETEQRREDAPLQSSFK